MTNVVALPALLTEREAAARLQISLSSLQRMRRRGDIEFTKIGRLVKYTERQLSDYLEAARCREKNEQARSEDIGYPKEAIRQNGAAPGSTLKLARQDVKALALRTLKKPSSNSPAG